jgi:hypothetical protein
MVRFFVGGYISNGTLYAKKHEKYCRFVALKEQNKQI